MGRSDESALRRVAERQHWLFTRAQAHACGFSDKQIHRRLSSGLWVGVHAGVYRTGPQDSRLQRIAAACLAAGGEAAASHRSAALIWGLEVASGRPEVTVPHARRRDRPDIEIYRSTTLRKADVAVHDRIRLTTPMRTLLDLAGVLDEAALEIALDETARKRLVTIERLRAYLRRPEFRNAAGSGVLRRLVAIRTDARIGGALETKFFRLLRRANLPIPVREYPVTTRRTRRRIDFAYVDAKVAVEIRDYESHTRRDVFDDDTIRREELEELGWHVVEVTWSQIEHAPDEVVMRVARALGLEPVRWRPTRRTRGAAARRRSRPAALPRTRR